MISILFYINLEKEIVVSEYNEEQKFALTSVVGPDLQYLVNTIIAWFCELTG